MAEALKAHLTALPPPQLARVALAVLGRKPDVTPELTATAVARQLLDPQWVAETLKRLGPGAGAALAAVARAGVPVLRKDVSALVADRNVDPVDQLEEHGLLTPVRTGRGMPTHVALTPGLEHLVSSGLSPGGHDGEATTFAGHRRRFELALMLAVVAQYPPRLTRTGRLHAGDLKRVEAHLQPLGLRATDIERKLGRWLDLGIAQERAGALRPNASAFTDVGRLFVLLALSELAAPSVPEGTLRVVERLARSGGAIDLRTALDITQAEMLRERSEELDSPSRGARTELLEVARSLLSLDALILQDQHGHPLPMHSPEELARETPPFLAIEPGVAAALRRESLPTEQFHRGHVQSSFEVVADSGSDPTVVARIAAWSELVRADRAVVLRLERASVVRAMALGLTLDGLLADLQALADRPPPTNVVILLKDWTAAAEPAAPLMESSLPAWDDVVGSARRAVLRED